MYRPNNKFIDDEDIDPKKFIFDISDDEKKSDDVIKPAPVPTEVTRVKPAEQKEIQIKTTHISSAPEISKAMPNDQALEKTKPTETHVQEEELSDNYEDEEDEDLEEDVEEDIDDEEEDLDDDIEDEEDEDIEGHDSEEASDIDDSDLMKRLESKYGKLQDSKYSDEEPEEEEDGDKTAQTWTSNYLSVTC